MTLIFQQDVDFVALRDKSDTFKLPSSWPSKEVNEQLVL